MILPFFLAITCVAVCAQQSAFGKSVGSSCDASLSGLRAAGALCANAANGKVICGGHVQVSGNNQNPFVAAFDQSGQQLWCRNDYERSGDDGTVVGVASTANADEVVVVFTATGTQGDASNDYRRFTADGWLSSYTAGSPGGGGGGKVLVLAVLAIADGAPLRGTFLTAILSSGKTNSVTRAVALLEDDASDSIALAVWSAFSPRGTDKKRLECDDLYSETRDANWMVIFNRQLSTAKASCAPACNAECDSDLLQTLVGVPDRDGQLLDTNLFKLASAALTPMPTSTAGSMLSTLANQTLTNATLATAVGSGTLNRTRTTAPMPLQNTQPSNDALQLSLALAAALAALCALVK